MKFKNIIASVAIATCLVSVGCKPKDKDIAAEAQKVVPANATVTVTEGVATLTGEFSDEASKKAAEEALAKVKDVKSVVNNATVIAPPPPPVAAPVVTAADEALTKGLKDATKDFSTVTATVADGVITLNGEIKKTSLAKLMMAINALKPKKIDNKLTIK